MKEMIYRDTDIQFLYLNNDEFLNRYIERFNITKNKVFRNMAEFFNKKEPFKKKLHNLIFYLVPESNWLHLEKRKKFCQCSNINVKH